MSESRGTSTCWWLCLSIGSFITIGNAQPRPQVQSSGTVVAELKVYRVIREDGAEKLQPADEVKPGELLEYRVHYRNGGRTAVRDVTALLPVPKPLIFISGSARPRKAQASTDGRRFASIPLRTRARQTDGSFKIVLVPLSQYRYVQWSLGTLSSGEVAQVAVRARVGD